MAKWKRLSRRPRGRQGIVRDEEGSTLIEFALILPVFFMLLFGTLQSFLALFSFCNATYASGVAARYASTHSSTSLAPASTTSVQAVATSVLWSTSPSTTAVTVTWSPSNTVGSTVNVSVKMTLPLAIPFTSMTQVQVGNGAQRLVVR